MHNPIMKIPRRERKQLKTLWSQRFPIITLGYSLFYYALDSTIAERQNNTKIAFVSICSLYIHLNGILCDW